MDLPRGNEESSTYGMNVTGPIFITNTQMRVMKVLHTDPELNNKTIGERIGRSRCSVQTAVVDLYQRTGASNRGELIAMASLMVEKDARGGNMHPMAKAYRLGLVSPPDTPDFYRTKCRNRKTYTTEVEAREVARVKNCHAHTCENCGQWHCRKVL